MNTKFTKNFYKAKPKGVTSLFKDVTLTKKQKIGFSFLIFCLGFTFVRAQFGFGTGVGSYIIKGISDAISSGANENNSNTTTAAVDAIAIFKGAFPWLDIVKNMMNYIISAQTNSISTISSLKFGSSSMFNHIYNGLTIFACIGCAYKIITHFLNTERFDSVKSFTGFFQYFGILLLFMFSDTIVNRLASMNTSINKSAVTSIVSNIDKELDNEIKKDAALLSKELNGLNESYAKMSALQDLGSIIQNRIDYITSVSYKFYFGNLVKYSYFTVFGLVLVSVLAVPTFIMAFMVKVLLSVMLAGTKVVFIMAFVPGFENVWKTFLMNIINVLLWIPIFNAMITFIVAIVTSTMVSNSMGGGQIVWLCIVAVICAYQSVSLSTSAASTIVQGAAAGMAGLMGGLATMSAGAVGAKAGGLVMQAGATAAGTVAGGPAGGAAGKLTK